MTAPLPKGGSAKQKKNDEESFARIFVVRSFPRAWLEPDHGVAHQIIGEHAVLQKDPLHFSCHSGKERSKRTAAALVGALGKEVKDLGAFPGLGPKWLFEKSLKDSIRSFREAEATIQKRRGDERQTVEDWLIEWNGAKILANEIRHTLFRITESALSQWPLDGCSPLTILAASHHVCGELAADKTTPILEPNEFVVYTVALNNRVPKRIVSAKHHGKNTPAMA